MGSPSIAVSLDIDALINNAGNVVLTRPEEVAAGTAVFLTSQASDFVTGTTILVDGGYSIR